MDSIDKLIEAFDSWSLDRQEEILQLIKDRWYAIHGHDFTDKELDEQFEEEQ